MSRTLHEAMAASAEAPPSIDRLSDHDRVFTARALTEKADRVEKIAKANQDAGYQREATVLRGDAAYAREQLVPAFTPQLDAFPDTMEEVQAGYAAGYGDRRNFHQAAIRKDALPYLRIGRDAGEEAS